VSREVFALKMVGDLLAGVRWVDDVGFLVASGIKTWQRWRRNYGVERMETKTDKELSVLDN
jgi:hypothetical protein